MNFFVMKMIRSLLLLVTIAPITLCLSIYNSNRNNNNPIPITVLSGFLGSGKTSVLTQLLNNNQGLRIAIIVNDVASVNIDSKLLTKQQQQHAQSAAAGIVELQNGCACCSLSEELLSSVSELVTLSDMRDDGGKFDHIVVELSGVADPKGVRAKFQDAVLYDMPLMERVRLDTLVTVVDCSIFLRQLQSARTANVEESPELFYRPGEEPPPLEEWQTDLPEPLLEALMAGQRVYGGAAGQETAGVADLLVSQCETSDVVLLNKVDLATDSEMSTIANVVKALNPRAKLYRTEYGNAPLGKILAVAGGTGVVQAGLVDDHKDAVNAALHQANTVDNSHHHSHSHSHEAADCTDPDCTDTSTSHSHEHVTCTDPDCQSTSHSHSHDHGCNDPDCTDPSHSHNHAHADLGTFVYRARRPFHPGRILSFLRRMPIQRGTPNTVVDELGVDFSQECLDTLQRVLRSKGFLWLADSDQAALYWSHAGVSFDIKCLGRWWATLPREQWPPEVAKTILEDFLDESDPQCGIIGDRRQELVFIGPGIGVLERQDHIATTLDLCLLNDREWRSYLDVRKDESMLQRLFPNLFESQLVTF